MDSQTSGVLAKADMLGTSLIQLLCMRGEKLPSQVAIEPAPSVCSRSETDAEVPGDSLCDKGELLLVVQLLFSHDKHGDTKRCQDIATPLVMGDLRV